MKDFFIFIGGAYILLVLMMAGYFIGSFMEWNRFHDEAVGSGHAHYDSQTSHFEWNTGGCSVLETDDEVSK